MAKSECMPRFFGWTPASASANVPPIPTPYPASNCNEPRPIWGHGEGRSKKQAEQAAAREAFDHLVSTVEEVSVDTDDEANGAGSGTPAKGARAGAAGAAPAPAGRLPTRRDA